MEGFLIGQGTHDVLVWYPTTILQCKCQEEGPPVLLVLTEFRNITICPRCKKGYMLTKITANGPEVECIKPTPAGQVM